MVPCGRPRSVLATSVAMVGGQGRHHSLSAFFKRYAQLTQRPMRTYKLSAIDGSGRLHTTSDTARSRAAAMRECIRFFSDVALPGCGPFRDHRVMNPRECRAEYVRVWTCARCGKSPEAAGDGNFWRVSDRKWRAVVSRQWRRHILCRQCFDELSVGELLNLSMAYVN
jgi:hypothetical protein